GPVTKPQFGDAVPVSVDLDVVTAAVPDGGDTADGIAIEVEAVAIPVGDGGQPTDGIVPRREMQYPAGRTVGDAPAIGRGGQGPSRAGDGKYFALLGDPGIDQDHAVVGDEHDAVVVELQSLIERRRPGAAVEATRTVGR